VELPVPVVYELIEAMKADFAKDERGIQLVEVAGAYQFATKPELAPYLERMAQSPSRASLSQAALETLSIVAYRQPVTRVEIEEIRGVNSDRALNTLLSKELIMEVGRSEAVGRPILYGTTPSFLQYFGLKGLEDLPDEASFGAACDLEEETSMLFEKLEGRQLSIDDLKDA
jgi:segregation and condensation protein B